MRDLSTIRGCPLPRDPIGDTMIDQLRRDIQQRLDQLLAEADKLRQALTALRGANGPSPTPTPARSRRTPTTQRGRGESARNAPARSPKVAPPSAPTKASVAESPPVSTSRPTRSRSAATPRRRTRAPLGQTKSTVLAALSNGNAMTAGEVAAATGLGRASVSTTLSKLAKTGEVLKADRGYRSA